MSLLTRTTVLLFAILVMAPFAASARPPIASPERLLFDALNRERASLGLSMLYWDDSLASAARQHAERMAQQNTLAHQLPGEPDLRMRAAGAGARYSVIAENVAVGPDPAVIHNEWMHSPGHRANILSSQLSVVGIAVVQGSMGLFAVQDFSLTVPNLSLEQQEQHVIPLLAARGLQVITAYTDARKTCELASGFAGTRPALVARYETANLNDLPVELERKIQSGVYRAAAVAACPVDGANGFARFRMTILLY
jgi:cysteine-rich secretory family protein